MTTIHVYPENDLAAHVLEGENCPCNPRVEVVEGGEIVVHNSWDGREEQEYFDQIKGGTLQ